MQYKAVFGQFVQCRFFLFDISVQCLAVFCPLINVQQAGVALYDMVWCESQQCWVLVCNILQL